MKMIVAMISVLPGKFSSALQDACTHHLALPVHTYHCTLTLHMHSCTHATLALCMPTPLHTHSHIGVPLPACPVRMLRHPHVHTHAYTTLPLHKLSHMCMHRLHCKLSLAFLRKP